MFVLAQVLMQGWNPGIQWEYTLTKEHTERRSQPKHNYTWAIVRSQCSASCAGGTDQSEHNTLLVEDNGKCRPDLTLQALVKTFTL